MSRVLLLLLAFALGWPATVLVLRAAVRRQLLDQPNARSSHSVPTPRGGGLAFVGVFLLLLPVVVALEPDSGRLALALGAGGLAVAAVGLVDDLRNVAAPVRAAVHALAAVLAVVLLGLPGGRGTLAVAGAALLVVVALVWVVNLCNFMDGIDGLAGGQAVVAAAGIALLASGVPAVTAVALVLAGAVLGFLVLNAPPARIFMGDVGSGFLGFVLGVLVLQTWAEAGVALPVAALLLAPFLVDATGTLALRVLRGERWYEPHRDHVYQRLTRSGLTHRGVSLLYVGLAALFVLEALALRDSSYAAPAAVGTFLVLVAAWVLGRLRTREASAAAG
jgi:Fuc2NAc and GlcNAc transferase